MTRLADRVLKVRSKNAGPFWLTVDIFCGNTDTFEAVKRQLATAAVCALYGVEEADILRFDMADLQVIKFSFPRPTIQGNRDDRDMHGASYACLLEELELPAN